MSNVVDEQRGSEVYMIEKGVRQPDRCLDAVDGACDDWQYVDMTVDSGAADSVMPLDTCTNYPLLEGEQKKLGVYYIAANGREMDNEGERRVRFTTQHGGDRNLTFQVTEVHKTLCSVSRLCEVGQQVVFNPIEHPDGSYIRDLRTDTITPIRIENGVYKLDAWIRPFSDGDPTGFGRREP